MADALTGEEFVRRYENDIPLFAEEVLGMPVHPGQRRFLDALSKRRSRWMALYFTIFLASGNRAGKTSALTIFIIHSCVFKTNVRSTWGDVPPEKAAKRWLQAEYHAYHFGIQHEVADLVFNELVRILDGVHPAQKDGCPFTKNGPIATWDVKEYGDFNWVKFLNGAQLHFRTTSQKALGTLGKDMHLITFDEAGLEPRLDFLIDEVFDFRRLGTGGQLVCVSTPSEDLGTTFADRWERGDPENPLREENAISLRMSTRDNIGFGLTQEMFDILTADFDERKMAQNIEGIFLQAKAAYFHAGNVLASFYPDLPERTPARKGMLYLQGVDPAKTQDSAWSIVLCVVADPNDPENPYLVGVRAEQKRGQKQTSTLVTLAAEAFSIYERPNMQTRCYTAIDATGFGGKMFREALDGEVPNVTNIEFGGTVARKRKLLGDLRTIIDSGRLLLPAEGIWKQVRKQLLAYKLEDRGIEQDAVMALVCAVALVRRTPADGVNDQPFDMNDG